MTERRNDRVTNPRSSGPMAPVAEVQTTGSQSGSRMSSRVPGVRTARFRVCSAPDRRAGGSDVPLRQSGECRGPGVFRGTLPDRKIADLQDSRVPPVGIEPHDLWIKRWLYAGQTP